MKEAYYTARIVSFDKDDMTFRVDWDDGSYLTFLFFAETIYNWFPRLFFVDRFLGPEMNVSGDPSGKVQKYNKVALNVDPDSDDIGVGQLVFFPQV